MQIEPGYESLAAVLQEALDQAQKGKGLRHAEDKPFDEQDLVQEAIWLGLAYPGGQARKKIKEAINWNIKSMEAPDDAIRNLLGAMVSCGALIIAIRNIFAMDTEQPTEQVTGEAPGKYDHVYDSILNRTESKRPWLSQRTVKQCTKPDTFFCNHTPGDEACVGNGTGNECGYWEVK